MTFELMEYNVDENGRIDRGTAGGAARVVDENVPAGPRFDGAGDSRPDFARIGEVRAEPVVFLSMVARQRTADLGEPLGISRQQRDGCAVLGAHLG